MLRRAAGPPGTEEELQALAACDSMILLPFLLSFLTRSVCTHPTATQRRGRKEEREGRAGGTRAHVACVCA